MSDNKKEFLDNLIEFIKTPFGIYLILIILIILFPPMNNVIQNLTNPSKNIISFYGWDFIYSLGGGLEINVVYVLMEIGIVTLVYFIYLQSKKK